MPSWGGWGGARTARAARACAAAAAETHYEETCLFSEFLEMQISVPNYYYASGHTMAPEEEYELIGFSGILIGISWILIGFSGI